MGESNVKIVDTVIDKPLLILERPSFRPAKQCLMEDIGHAGMTGKPLPKHLHERQERCRVSLVVLVKPQHQTVDLLSLCRKELSQILDVLESTVCL
jgi:hypothetical protein